MEDRKFYVYEHYRLDNMTCFYVGKGYGTRADKLSRNYHHDNISKKYGHVVVIVADNLTEEEAHWLERDLIEEYVFDYGYTCAVAGCHKNYENDSHLTNCTWGGEGSTGRVISEETRKKIGESQKDKTISEETRKKISESQKGKCSGENNGFYGKTHTEETKKKISEQSKRLMSDPNIRKHISESLKGEKNPMYGKHMSEDAKKKLSTSHSIAVVQLTLNNKFVRTYVSAKETKKFGFQPTWVTQCCKHNTRQHKGYKWIYLKDYKTIPR